MRRTCQASRCRDAYWSGRPPRSRISATYSPSEEPAWDGVDPYLISTTSAPFGDTSSSTRLISRSRLPRSFVWATLTRTRTLGDVLNRSTTAMLLLSPPDLGTSYESETVRG